MYTCMARQGVYIHVHVKEHSHVLVTGGLDSIALHYNKHHVTVEEVKTENICQAKEHDLFFAPDRGRSLCTALVAAYTPVGGSVSGHETNDLATLSIMQRPFGSTIGADFILVTKKGRLTKREFLKTRLFDKTPSRFVNLNPDTGRGGFS